jgi:hypothetical protein
MGAHGPRYHIGAYLLLALALGIPCIVAGCWGGEGGSKPAAIPEAQQKKMQEYFGGYREQLIATAKAKAKAKTGSSAQKSR